jgi:hypothetical protein
MKKCAQLAHTHTHTRAVHTQIEHQGWQADAATFSSSRSIVVFANFLFCVIPQWNFFLQKRRLTTTAEEGRGSRLKALWNTQTHTLWNQIQTTVLFYAISARRRSLSTGTRRHVSGVSCRALLIVRAAPYCGWWDQMLVDHVRRVVRTCSARCCVPTCTCRCPNSDCA